AGCGVAHDPVGSGGSSGWAARWWRDDDVCPALFALGIKQDGSARTIGGHAELAGRSLGESPWVGEIPVPVRSQPGNVRDQWGLDVPGAQQTAILQTLDPQAAGRPPTR